MKYNRGYLTEGSGGICRNGYGEAQVGNTPDDENYSQGKKGVNRLWCCDVLCIFNIWVNDLYDAKY